jgi:hypothetical protein
MLSITMIIGFARVVKNQVQKMRHNTGWNVDSKKASSSKKQVAGPG